MKNMFPVEKNITREMAFITELFLFYDFINVLNAAIFISMGRNDIQCCIFQQPRWVIMHEFTG